MAAKSSDILQTQTFTFLGTQEFQIWCFPRLLSAGVKFSSIRSKEKNVKEGEKKIKKILKCLKKHLFSWVKEKERKKKKEKKNY